MTRLAVYLDTFSRQVRGTAAGISECWRPSLRAIERKQCRAVCSRPNRLPPFQSHLIALQHMGPNHNVRIFAAKLFEMTNQLNFNRLLDIVGCGKW
jgi:hypothetical protein